MATAFMKWLERSPADYERGIQLLTLGRLERLQRELVENHIGSGDRVLEVGCGPGTLSVRMAAAGARVTALDRSRSMVEQAEIRLAQAGVAGAVPLIHADAATIGDRFEAGSFDRVVCSLVLSEMPDASRRLFLRECHRVLAPNGRLLVIEEVRAAGWGARVLQAVIQLPLRSLSWLLTRTGTRLVPQLAQTLELAGFKTRVSAQELAGTLQLLVSEPAAVASAKKPLRPVVVGELAHHTSLRTWLLNLWELVFRILPPYPSWEPGVYTLGDPGPKDPVLVTGNYDLTLRRLAWALEGQLDAWVLVVDSSGINVWCAAGGGFLTAERIAGGLRSSGLDGFVNHHAMVLPQLCANGVDGWRLREETGWGVHWGPVRAEDLPAYLAAGRKKPGGMRWVAFPLLDRFEMMTATLGFYALLILLPVAIFWRPMLGPVTVSLLSLSFFYAAVHPLLPGRDGLAKSLPLALLAVGGMLIHSALFDPVGAPTLFGRGVGLSALALFVAAELQGMSPLMRGEQANWGWEAAIGAALGAIYWLLPRAVGWR